MPFKREDDKITLEMTVEDWENLLLALGYATGAAYKSGDELKAQSLIKFVNRLNLDNLGFIPYITGFNQYI